MFGLSSLYVKLIGGLFAALVVIGLVLGLKHYKGLAESRGESLAVICQATRDASGQPKLKCGEVPAQIKFMGEAIGTLTTAIHKQNEAVAAMGSETKRQQDAAAKASHVANERAKAPEAASARFEASSRSKATGAAEGQFSNTLEGAWR